MAAPPSIPAPALPVPVASLHEIQDIIKSGRKDVVITFCGRIDRISEATAMVRLLAQAEEQGWEVLAIGLDDFARIDGAVAKSRITLIHIIKTTKRAIDVDLSAASDAAAFDDAASDDADLSASAAKAKRSLFGSASADANLSHSSAAKAKSSLFGSASDDADADLSASAAKAKRSLFGSASADADANLSHSSAAKAKRFLYGSASDDADADLSASHHVGSAKRSRMSLPEYGTAAYAQLVADALHGRSPISVKSSPGSGSSPPVSVKSSPGERLYGRSPGSGKSPRVSVKVSVKSSPGERFNPSGLDSPKGSGDRDSPLVGIDSPGRVSNSPGGRVSNSPGGRVSNSPGVLVSNSPGVLVSNSPGVLISNSPGRRGANLHRIGRPFGRFVTPDVANEVREAGLRLMRCPLLKVAELGDKFCKMAKDLIRDKEGADILFQKLVSLKEEADTIWNGSSSVKDLLTGR